tara:strand:+ start:211 stop:681 length:471 start_codon:yes stop_codon:yes gene_type:complete
MNKFYIAFILLFMFACTASPRYHAGGQSILNKETKKQSKGNSRSNFNTNKKKYTGVSSWYGPQFHGNLTANGEVYDMYGITAAHKEFPLNTVARVTNLDNDKSIILRINDRGPYVDGRILDCSYGAALKLEFADQGTANVKIEIIEWGDDVYMHHN